MNARISRLAVAALGLVAVAAPGALGATPAIAPPPLVVRPTQELAVLLTSHEAWSAPDRNARPVSLVQARRPITDVETVLPVIGRAIGAGRLAWLRIRLPGRPNGRTGWIAERGTLPDVTSWHLVVSTARRRVTAYRDGRAVRAFTAIVGKPSTPTPHGEFFVEESVRLSATDVGAPFALALSARSDVLQEFAGGPGQIALHGLVNIGGVLGTAVSHGCIRLGDDAIRWLTARIGPGVPVTVTD